ncbi:MAG: Cache 3/Cache 2 fusion domain-containing protein [Actinomycetota bacterium]
MPQKEFGSLSLRLKLSAIVALVIAGVMGSFGYVAIGYLNRAATEEAVRQLAATNHLVRDLVDASQEGMRIAVGKLGETLSGHFSGRFTLDVGKRVEWEGISTPRLALNGRPLNFDYSEIDRFSQASGGNAATIFARDGDDFVRISTSLVKEDGTRAVGTRLERSHPAYPKMIAGQVYRGHARLFGTHYMTEYRPIADASGKVIGILFVGMDLTSSLDSLRQTLREFVIGGSGYLVVVDGDPAAKGRLVVHRTREGKALGDGLTEMEARVVETTLSQRNGVMFYDWTSPESGSGEPRRKVAVLDESAELGWIIVSSGYLDEFTGTATAGRRYMAIATVIVSIVLILALNLGIGRMVLLPMWREIDRRKQKEREVASYRDHLEELVAERTADLVAARAEAERLAQVRSEFLANMSHEIRTPLNGVLGMAHIGYRESEGQNKAREAFAKILNSGRLLLGIINDILDFSRIEAGKLPIDRVAFNLSETIDHAVDLVAERAREKGISLRVEKDAGLPAYCEADPLRLGQILLNVLSNAVKFTEAGGVTLAVSREGDTLILSVSDTGIGMSAEQLERIFSPFEQGDSSTTRRFGGTGLGLAITQRIVELMGGTIRAASVPGQGSTFEIRLPLAEAAAPQGLPASRPSSAGGRRLEGLSILVAEDNEINQLVLQENLAEEGARVLLAGTGREAVDRVAEQGRDAFDLVLMDIQMPDMDGYEATREILEIAPDLPVIGQTAHAGGEERGRCLAAGMAAHIAKPIDPEELVALALQHARRPRVRPPEAAFTTSS